MNELLTIAPFQMGFAGFAVGAGLVIEQIILHSLYNYLQLHKDCSVSIFEKHLPQFSKIS